MKAWAALALILAASATASASWAGLMAPLAPVLDTAGQGGLAGTLGATLGEAPEAPQPQEAATFTCGGTAPITTGCAADLTAEAGQSWHLYVSGGTGFTGSVVATLTDAAGNAATWTCTYVLYVGGVSEAPSCRGSGADLAGGSLRLVGAVPDATSGSPGAGMWEVGVAVS